MREEEAREKECRNSGAYTISGMMTPPEFEFPKCSGSDCMNWRTRFIGGVEMTEEGERECLKEIGYCGLAGK